MFLGVGANFRPSLSTSLSRSVRGFFERFRISGMGLVWGLLGVSVCRWPGSWYTGQWVIELVGSSTILVKDAATFWCGSPGAVAALQSGASVLLDMLGVSRSVGISNSLGGISMLQLDCCGGWGASCVSYGSVGGLVGSGAGNSCDCRLLPVAVCSAAVEDGRAKVLGRSSGPGGIRMMVGGSLSLALGWSLSSFFFLGSGGGLLSWAGTSATGRVAAG